MGPFPPILFFRMMAGRHKTYNQPISPVVVVVLVFAGASDRSISAESIICQLFNWRSDIYLATVFHTSPNDESCGYGWIWSWPSHWQRRRQRQRRLQWMWFTCERSIISVQSSQVVGDRPVQNVDSTESLRFFCESLFLAVLQHF